MKIVGLKVEDLGRTNTLGIILSLWILNFMVTGCYFPVNLKNAVDRKNLEREVLTQPISLGEGQDIEITVFKTGNGHTKKALMYNGGSWSDPVDNVFVSVLVKHPKGTFIFDTGLGRQFLSQFEANSLFFKTLVKVENLSPLADQLAKEKIGKVDFIIPSHLHWDHAGGVEDFPGLPVWIQKSELDWAKTQPLPHVMTEQFDDPQINWKFYELNKKPFVVYEESYDVFNDGSITLVPIKGHSPGTVGMIVNMKSGRKLFFSSDCSWAEEGILLPAEKSFLVANVMKPDMDRLEVRSALIQAHKLKLVIPELEIVPAHDGSVYKRMGYFPNWIK